MKNNLGFPASDLHLSPLNGATRSSKGTVPSVPYTTPSSPWLRIQKTKASESVWSSRDPEIPCQKHSVLLAIITLIRSVKNIYIPLQVRNYSEHHFKVRTKSPIKSKSNCTLFAIL